MNYRGKLIKGYYSTHYRHFMPQTVEGWNWVINRIELNFGDIFSSIPKDSLILDIGCGVGYLEYYLLKKGFTKIEAIDLSEEQIQVAKDRLREYGLDFAGKATFHLADAFQFLRQEGGKRYNAIVMIDFLEHLDKEKVIEILELSYNALEKDGLIFLRVINADNPMWGRFFYHDFTHEIPFTPDTLRQCLTLTGFEPVRIAYEKLPSGNSGILAWFKRKVRRLELYFLGKVLGISPDAFTGDLIAVGKKQ